MSYNFDWMQDKFLTLFYFDNCVPTEVNSLLTNDRERTFFFMFVLYSSKQSCRKNTKHFCVVYALCYFMYIAWRIFIANVKWQMTVFSTKVGIACHQWWVRAVIPTVDRSAIWTVAARRHWIDHSDSRHIVNTPVQLTYVNRAPTSHLVPGYDVLNRKPNGNIACLPLALCHSTVTKVK